MMSQHHFDSFLLRKQIQLIVSVLDFLFYQGTYYSLFIIIFKKNILRMGCNTSNEATDPVYSPGGLSLRILNKDEINITIQQSCVKEESNQKASTLILYGQAQKIVNKRIQKLQTVINQLQKTKFVNDFLRSLLVQKANNLFSVGRYEQAIVTLKQAIKICDQLGINRSINYVGMYNNIGVCLGKLKKRKAARKKLIQALNLYFQIKDTLFHHMLSVLLSNLALYLKKKKDRKEQVPRQKQNETAKQPRQQRQKPVKTQIIIPKDKQQELKQISEVIKQKSVNPRINKQLLKQLGLDEFIQGEYDSLKIFQTLLKFAKEESSQIEILTAKIYHNIANRIGMSGDYKLSRIYYQKAEGLKLTLFKGPNNHEVASTKLGLANCLFKLGDFKEGLIVYEQIFSIVKAIGSQNYKMFVETMYKYLGKNIQYMLANEENKALEQEIYLARRLIQTANQQAEVICLQIVQKLMSFKKNK